MGQDKQDNMNWKGFFAPIISAAVTNLPEGGILESFSLISPFIISTYIF